MNQKGAILPSVVIFVFLITTVMIGTTRIYKNQMQQLMMTENYYLIQTMLVLSKTEVQRQLVESGYFKDTVFIFEEGEVEVQKAANNTYTFIGETKNRVVNPINISVSFPEKNDLIIKVNEKK